MHWQGSCTTWEGDKLLGATPCTCTHGQTHTEAHGNEDNLLQKSYTQPRVRLQRLGVCVVEDPVLPGSPRTRRVSQWKSTAAKRSIPEKGPVRMATALPFSSGISEVPSCLPALSGRLQRTGDRDVGSLDGVSDAIRHDCQHDSGTRRQTVRNTRSPPATQGEYKTQDINYITSARASVLPPSYSAAEDGAVG